MIHTCYPDMVGLFNTKCAIICNNKSDEIGHMLWCCYIYLEYVGDNCEVMFILLLVELLQEGGVIALTVCSHLVPHLSLLSRLKEKKHTHKQAHYRHALLAEAECPLINVNIWVTHTYTHSQSMKNYMS